VSKAVPYDFQRRADAFIFTKLRYLLSESGKKHEVGFHIIAVENLDPEEGRIKIYVDVNNNSWNVVRDVMTLGGRLNDEVSLRGLEILKSIYHLIRDEPEDRPDDYSKPFPPDMPFPGIQFGFDLTAGNPIPSIKLYGHMRRLSNFDSKKAADNQVKILQKLGHPWGFNGQLETVMKSVK
jgi:DMATS type aromatic prenyltransferase